MCSVFETTKPYGGLTTNTILRLLGPQTYCIKLHGNMASKCRDRPKSAFGMGRWTDKSTGNEVQKDVSEQKENETKKASRVSCHISLSHSNAVRVET